MILLAVVGIAGCSGASGAADTSAAATSAPSTAVTTTSNTVPRVTTSSAPTTTSTTVPPTTERTVESLPADACGSTTPAGDLLEVSGSRGSPYFLRHPADPEPATATVVFLPGGTTGSRRGAERVWERYLSQGDGVDDFRIVIPFAEDYDLVDDISRMYDIVDEVLGCHGGDVAKVHIAGFSQGGQIAFRLMLSRPEMFATALGAPGEFRLIEPDRWRERLAGKAIFLGVGELDTDWMEYIKLIHEGLIEAGIEAVYVEFPGEEHRLSEEFDESIFFEFWSSH